MKDKINTSVIILLLMSILVGCKTEENFSAEYIKEVNNNSNLGIALTTDSGLTEKQAKNYHKDQPYIIYSEGKDTEYYCFRYPDEDAPLMVTQIRILDKEYDVFGVHIGDRIKDSVSVLQEYGYKQMDYPVENALKFKKGDIEIYLRYESDTIISITLSVSTDAEEGVKY